MSLESINNFKDLWTQENIGFVTLLFSVIMFVITYSSQEKANLKEFQKQNASKKIELWLRFQDQMNKFIDQIDSKFDELVAKAEDTNIICKHNISSLTKGEDDEIINIANAVIRQLSRMYSLKQQYLEMYKEMDDSMDIVQSVEKTWEKDVMPYYYFYLDKEKKTLFVSSLDKGMKNEYYTKDFYLFCQKIIEENKTFNEQLLKDLDNVA